MATAVAQPVAHPVGVASSYSTPSAAHPPGQPDIEYAPDYAKFQARSERRIKDETLPTSVPEGFPDQLQGDMVWDGEKLAESYDWTYVLTGDQLTEIDEALKHFQCEFPPFQGPGQARNAHHRIPIITSSRSASAVHHAGYFPAAQASLRASPFISRAPFWAWIFCHPWGARR